MKTNIADRTKAEFDAAIRKAIEDQKRDTREATVMLDLLSHRTVDMALNPISSQNEHADAAFMVYWNDFPPCMVVCDRQLKSFSQIKFMQGVLTFAINSIIIFSDTQKHARKKGGWYESHIF